MSIDPVLNRLLRSILGESLAVSFKNDLGLSDAISRDFESYASS